MTAPMPAGEDDLVDLLRRDPVRALGLIHARHGERLAGFLKRVTWGLLSVEDHSKVFPVHNSIKGA